MYIHVHSYHAFPVIWTWCEVRKTSSFDNWFQIESMGFWNCYLECILLSYYFLQIWILLMCSFQTFSSTVPIINFTAFHCILRNVLYLWTMANLPQFIDPQTNSVSGKRRLQSIIWHILFKNQIIYSGKTKVDSVEGFPVFFALIYIWKHGKGILQLNGDAIGGTDHSVARFDLKPLHTLL